MAGNDRSMQWLSHGSRLFGLSVIGGMLVASGLIGHWLAEASTDHAFAREQASASIAQQAAIDRRLIDRRQSVADATLECDAISASLPQGPQESRFIAQLANMAEESGVQIDDFRPGRKLDYGDGVGELELRLFCEGSYESFCTFLEQTRELKRLVHIASLRISPLDQSGNRVTAELQLRLLFSQSRPVGIAHTEAIHAK